MNIGKLAVMTSLIFTWIEACGIAGAASQGNIQFFGNIMNPSCSFRSTGTLFELKDCPAVSRRTPRDVRSVLSVRSVSSKDAPDIGVQLIISTERVGPYDQSYVLVNKVGTLIRTGRYVVTLTSP